MKMKLVQLRAALDIKHYGYHKKRKKFSSLFPIFIIQKEQISHDSVYLS